MNNLTFYHTTMPEPTPKRPPVKLLNEQVYYEHGGNPFKGLHRWYSRKPLSFSRASVLGSLLPADVTMAEFEYLLGLEPGKEVKLYKTPPGSVQIKKVQDYCDRVWGTRTPTVLDAFAGGGSIPFEAARYGLNVLASDLNPVAVVTMKAAMEYPLKFGPDLQQDIDKWVKWVGDEAEKRLAEFFPSLPGETVQNYLWAHTVICPNCESVVPLSPNWWLYKRPEKQNLHKWCAVKPIPNPENKRVDFELVRGKKGKGTTIQTADGEYDPDTTTTISRGVGKCPNCGNVIDDEAIKRYSSVNNLGNQLYAIVHALNLNWSYPELNGAKALWLFCAESVSSEYIGLCSLSGIKLGSTGIPGIEQHDTKSIQIDSASADNLTHIPDKSVYAIITDPPYYSTIQYAELSDFFYVWLKRTLGDILPELFYLELTDKDREAVANPSRFRNMGASPEELANQDYEAKMALAFAEYYPVLRDDGVMTVQFNHKDSGAWDVLAYSLIEAGFAITASWTVSTENPQNLHQAQKQRFKKHAFSLTDSEFSTRYLVDGLHAIITLYLEEQSIEPVRRFMKATGLVSNDLFMRSFEVALKVIPRIGDEKKRIPEQKALADLWLAIDEIKAKVVYVQPALPLTYGQKSLDLNIDINEDE